MAVDDPQSSSGKTSTELAGERTGLAHERSDLAVDRTMLAHERTLMAWTRTATSLISFGFTLYTFFHNFGNRERDSRPAGAINAALAMISVGLIALLLATIRHHKDVRELEVDYGAQPRHTAPIVAGLIVVLGIFGLITVLFRL